MPDLLDKLNVLVRSSLNSVLSGDTTRRIPPERLGKDIDNEIAALRKHIEDALNAEDAMQARVSAANAQAEALDRQADDALLAGDEVNARYLVQQHQRQVQQATMRQTELEEHRRATSDLIERVNTLEAMVSDSRRAQTEPLPTDPSDDVQSTAQPASGSVLSNLLRDARQTVTPSAPTASTTFDAPARSVPITIHRDAKPTAPTSEPTTQDQIKAVVDQAQVDDDLARRRSRLSKPDGS